MGDPIICPRCKRSILKWKRESLAEVRKLMKKIVPNLFKIHEDDLII